MLFILLNETHIKPALKHQPCLQGLYCRINLTAFVGSGLLLLLDYKLVLFPSHDVQIAMKGGIPARTESGNMGVKRTMQFMDLFSSLFSIMFTMCLMLFHTSSHSCPARWGALEDKTSQVFIPKWLFCSFRSIFSWVSSSLVQHIYLRDVTRHVPVPCDDTHWAQCCLQWDKSLTYIKLSVQPPPLRVGSHIHTVMFFGILVRSGSIRWRPSVLQMFHNHNCSR